MPFPRVRGRWLAPLTALLPVVVAAAVGSALPDAGAAAPALFLGAVAGGVLALLAVAAPGPAATRVALGSVLFVPLLARPLDDPTPWAIAFGLLAVAVVTVATGLGTIPPRERALRAIAWSTAAQWTLHADRIWIDPRDPATLLLLVGAPALAGLAIAALARSDDRLGLVAGLLAFSAGPGWALHSILGLCAAALVARAAAQRGIEGLAPACAVLAALPGALAGPPWLTAALAGLGALAVSPADAASGRGTRRVLAPVSRGSLGIVAFLALVTLGGGAPPWSLDRPLARVLEALEAFARRPQQVLHQGRSLRVGDAPLRFEVPPDASIETVAVDSFLLDGTTLECGQPIVELALLDGDQTIWSRPVTAGRDTGGWAAERPEVRARSLCAAPRPFQRWPSPAARFLSRRYRAHWRLETPTGASSIALRPVAGGPAGGLVVTRVAIGW